ncbi:hypothetical protein BJ742DRAFT_824753 [Cladochytrium replicatum]|nr:hypothetical protein BJ742DRAFT_824753 [Cladochytrium replicatum]
MGSAEPPDADSLQVKRALIDQCLLALDTLPDLIKDLPHVKLALLNLKSLDAIHPNHQTTAHSSELASPTLLTTAFRKWTNLTLDVLDRIFYYLDFRDLLELARLNTHWGNVARIHLYQSPPLPTVDKFKIYLDAIARGSSRLESAAGSRQFMSLRVLNLSAFELSPVHTPGKSTAALATQLIKILSSREHRGLQSLSLKGVHLDTLCSILENCPKVTTLELAGGVHLTDLGSGLIREIPESGTSHSSQDHWEYDEEEYLFPPLTFFARTLRQLHRFAISGCDRYPCMQLWDRFARFCLLRLSSNCLREFLCLGVPSLPTDALERFAQRCAPRLRVLEVEGAFGQSGAGDLALVLGASTVMPTNLISVNGNSTVPVIVPTPHPAHHDGGSLRSLRVSCDYNHAMIATTNAVMLFAAQQMLFANLQHLSTVDDSSRTLSRRFLLTLLSSQKAVAAAESDRKAGRTSEKIVHWVPPSDEELMGKWWAVDAPDMFSDPCDPCCSPALRSLIIDSIHLADEELLLAIARTCPLLENVQFPQGDGMTDNVVEEFVLRCGKSLRNISLHYGGRTLTVKSLCAIAYGVGYVPSQSSSESVHRSEDARTLHESVSAPWWGLPSSPTQRTPTSRADDLRSQHLLSAATPAGMHDGGGCPKLRALKLPGNAEVALKWMEPLLERRALMSLKMVDMVGIEQALFRTQRTIGSSNSFASSFERFKRIVKRFEYVGSLRWEGVQLVPSDD